MRGVVGPPGLRPGCAPRAQRGRWAVRRPSAKLRVCAEVAVRRCGGESRAGGRRVPRLLPRLALPPPTLSRFPTSQTSLYDLRSLEFSNPLKGRVGNFSLRAAATVSLPRTRRIGEIAPPLPILLATLEAVNESLWGILLNFSNQVSSDLMPPV